jgi:hypothetical protein
VLGDDGYVQHLLLQSQAPPGGGFQDFTTNKGFVGCVNFMKISLKFVLKFSKSETAHPWFGPMLPCITDVFAVSLPCITVSYCTHGRTAGTVQEFDNYDNDL